jgi:hypothetical protein
MRKRQREKQKTEARMKGRRTTSTDSFFYSDS